jgi:hypothetical protein
MGQTNLFAEPVANLALAALIGMAIERAIRSYKSDPRRGNFTAWFWLGVTLAAALLAGVLAVHAIQNSN